MLNEYSVGLPVSLKGQSAWMYCPVPLSIYCCIWRTVSHWGRELMHLPCSCVSKAGVERAVEAYCVLAGMMQAGQSEEKGGWVEGWSTDKTMSRSPPPTSRLSVSRHSLEVEAAETHPQQQSNTKWEDMKNGWEGRQSPWHTWLHSYRRPTALILMRT